jgi:hypothetical protein
MGSSCHLSEVHFHGATLHEDANNAEVEHPRDVVEETRVVELEVRPGTRFDRLRWQRWTRAEISHEEDAETARWPRQAIGPSELVEVEGRRRDGTDMVQGDQGDDEQHPSRRGPQS